MKPRHLSGAIFTCFITLLLPVCTWAATVNLASSGTATASGSYTTFTPHQAIDDSLSTSWLVDSAAPPAQWIEIDLGGIFEIDTIRANVIQSPEGETTHHVYLDNIFSFSWIGATTDGDWLETTFLGPVFAQSIKIETTISPSWVGWREIQVLSEVPVPATAWLLGSGLLSLIGVARRKKAA